MIRSKPVATIILLVVTLLFLMSYAHRQEPWWALLMHMSGAAMIGGLADWYAVTAIFTKPLGIPFKTAILPRSKNRLVQMGRHMISEELLRIPTLYYAIKRKRLVTRFIDYGLTSEGQQQIEQMLTGLTQQVLCHMDIGPFRKAVNQAVIKGVAQWRVTPLVILFGRCMLERKTAETLWLYFNRTCQQVIVSKQVYPYLYHVMDAIMHRYTRMSLFRELVIAFGGESLHPQRLVVLVQKKAVAFLQANESLDSPLGRYLWGQAILFFNTLETNKEWQDFIEDHKNRWFRVVLGEWQESLLTGKTVDWQRLITFLLLKWQRWGRRLQKHPERYAQFERFLLLRAIGGLQKIHPMIDKVVGAELEAYSSQELTRIVRSKLYYDLQMVRINGSLVGAVLGGLFYGITVLIKGVLL